MTAGKNKMRMDDLTVQRRIGIRIRMRRNEAGLTQTELGERLGVTFQQIQKYEKGVNRVGGARLAQLAEALGVNVEFFYRGIEFAVSDEPRPPALVESFIASKIGLRTARAFAAITDENMRTAVINLIEAAAKGA
jgi:transcriptional regulator with XRE-family HTH domain